MKWFYKAIIILVVCLILFPYKTFQVDPQVKAFGISPTLYQGRVQPMDSFARTVLLQLHGSQSYSDAEGKKQPAILFLYTLSTNREQAEKIELFRVDHPQIRAQLDAKNPSRKYFSLKEIKASKAILQEQLKDIINLRESDNAYFASLYKLSNQRVIFDSTYELLQKQHVETFSQVKLSCEALLNTYTPFVKCIYLYTLAFLCILLFWLSSRRELRNGALLFEVLGLSLHTLALISRMYIQGRPPVTSIYSSAIFIGWAGVFIGLILEVISRKGYGIATATVLGTCSLIIAHNLVALSDNLGVMQAAINSNFWLSTHVITITLGYSSAFIAGTLGIFILLKDRKKETTSDLDRMLFGIVCLALFFSFLGTLLGGIWADQAWGRFWGWDPKENGALMIILWYALMLHAKYGKLVSAQGFAALAVFGNCITAWSWFGTNLLNVGLHSYGFTGNGALWLGIFCISQILILVYRFTVHAKY